MQEYVNEGVVVAAARSSETDKFVEVAEAGDPP